MSEFSIWVAEYSYVEEYPRSITIYWSRQKGAVRLPYAYVVIKRGDEITLVDVGHNDRGWAKQNADRLGVEGWRSPDHVLGKLGFSPADVSNIILTHLHFDHAGNLGAFPNAQVYVQEKELTRNVWAMSLPPRMAFLSTGVDPGDVLTCVELGRAGRLILVDGDAQDLLPGIDVHAVYDSHTFASMYVVVRSDRTRESAGAWVVTGDLIYVYENIVSDDPEVIGDEDVMERPYRYSPVGFAVGSHENLIHATEEIIDAAGGNLKKLVMVHEDRLGQLYPSAVGEDGLRLTEICLADGETSRVSSASTGAGTVAV
jgi:N-acyl homoserine lactone hydrolase